MFERFTDSARRSLTLAKEEAKRQEHDFIGTEHLLLGLLAAGEGLAFDALTALDVTLEETREKVAELIHPSKTVSTGSPPFTPLAKKVLEKSLRESLDLGDRNIGSEHVLLALTAVPDGGAVQVLRHLGAGNLDLVREEILTRMHRRPAPPLKVVASMRSRLWSTRGGGGVASASQPPPRCAKCQASLLEEARFRVIQVPAGDEADGEAELDPVTVGELLDRPAPVPVTVIYCRHCGTALGMA